MDFNRLELGEFLDNLNSDNVDFTAKFKELNNRSTRITYKRLEVSYQFLSIVVDIVSKAIKDYPQIPKGFQYLFEILGHLTLTSDLMRDFKLVNTIKTFGKTYNGVLINEIDITTKVDELIQKWRTNTRQRMSRRKKNVTFFQEDSLTEICYFSSSDSVCSIRKPLDWRKPKRIFKSGGVEPKETVYKNIDHLQSEDKGAPENAFKEAKKVIKLELKVNSDVLDALGKNDDFLKTIKKEKVKSKRRRVSVKCRAWLKGMCRLGDKCQFSHE